MKFTINKFIFIGYTFIIYVKGSVHGAALLRVCKKKWTQFCRDRRINGSLSQLLCYEILVNFHVIEMRSRFVLADMAS